MTSSFSFMSRVLQVKGWADFPSDPTFPPGHTRKTKNYFALQVIANIPENSNDPSRTLSQTSLTNSEPGRPDMPQRKSKIQNRLAFLINIVLQNHTKWFAGL